MSKYSDDLMNWLLELGYTHCFFVAGGNAMHLIDSARTRFECTPFINEIGAGVAAESFNEVCSKEKRAFVLITAGPALTNVVTAIASAWVDRRELLVIGGQAKSSDLASENVRQVGFQEICGTKIVAPITKTSLLVNKQISKSDFVDAVLLGKAHPKGPIFIEVCLDVSMQETDSRMKHETISLESKEGHVNNFPILELRKLILESKRPLVLLGGQLERESTKHYLESFIDIGIPIATSFNGADRIGFEYPYYCGRPGWYGSRWANLIIQQADLLISIGARLGVMQTGYNVKDFAPNCKVVQIDSDISELNRGDVPREMRIQTNPNYALQELSVFFRELPKLEIESWCELIKKIKASLFRPEKFNKAEKEVVEYASFAHRLTEILNAEDQINPCSSGGNFESFGKVMVNKKGQNWVTSPGLASMGFGLSGGIGMSLAHPKKRTIVFEGDGGFAQNLQELGVVRSNNLNLKLFIASNGNYGSIKAHQKSAFNDNYIGCDRETGLWLPDWNAVARAFSIPYFPVQSNDFETESFMEHLDSSEPCIFEVKVDPDQVILPKIVSVKKSSGEVVSNPLHRMYPEISESELTFLTPHI